MENGEKKKVLSGFAWKFAERIVSQGIKLALSVILARLLMPAEYGTIAMIAVFITISDVFVSAGFTSSLIQKKDSDNLDFSTMFYCSMVLAAVIYVVIYFAAPYIAIFYNMPALTQITRVYAIILFLNSFYSIQSAWVSRHMVFKKFFFVTSIGTFLSGVIGVIMAYKGYGVWALIGQALSNVSINIIVMNCIIAWRPRLEFSWKRAKSLMNYGSKILAASLIGSVCNEMRQLLVGKFYSASDLAFFNRGKTFPSLVYYNVDSTINTVLFPAMSNHSDDPERVKQLTRRTIRTSSYVMFFCMGVLAVIARPLTEILLTEKWLPSVPYMQIMCVGYMVSSVSTANLQAIKALGRSDVTLKLELYKKPIFILMLVVSVKISVLALAISMPLYSLYAAYVNMSPNKKLMGYGFKEQIRDYMPATLLFIVMVCAALPFSFLKMNAFLVMGVQICVCVLVYVGLSLIFRLETFVYLKNTFMETLLRRR